MRNDAQFEMRNDRVQDCVHLCASVCIVHLCASLCILVHLNLVHPCCVPNSRDWAARDGKRSTVQTTFLFRSSSRRRAQGLAVTAILPFWSNVAGSSEELSNIAAMTCACAPGSRTMLWYQRKRNTSSSTAIGAMLRICMMIFLGEGSTA